MSAGGGEGLGDRPAPYVRLVLAPNPGPFTLEGTNTWIVGRAPSVVIDPGPPDQGHLEAVRWEAGDVAAILVTHQHPDHAPGGRTLSEMTGAPVLAFAPGDGEAPLADGQIVVAGEARLRAIHTPGHTPDHVVLLEEGAGILFTGDAVLGRGTSVIDPPDGDLADYLRSLDSMLALGASVICPGHGPVVWDADAKLREYLAHREERERQVLAALEAGPASPEEMVPAIYADHPPEIHPAAARSVLAHLLKLEREGRVVRLPGPTERFERSVPPSPAGPQRATPARAPKRRSAAPARSAKPAARSKGTPSDPPSSTT